MPQNKLVIIDGNAIIHRAYHALPALTTKDGTMVNAVYGFISILLKVLKELQPTHLVVTFDLAGPTFRDELYKEYKATRVKADQSLYDQIPLVHDAVRAFDIPIFEVSGFEADDVIGTVAEKTKDDTENIIVTGDLDAAQLVNDHTFVYLLRKGITDTVMMDAAAVKEKYGLTPEQIVDYKSLKGDTSDNIPGVKGIGEKTAVELLQKYESLDGVLAAADNERTTIAPGVRKKLQEGKDDAHLSKQLATIRTDVPLAFAMNDAALHTTDWHKVAAMLQRFEFTSLLKRLPVQEFGAPIEEKKTKKAGGARQKTTVIQTKKDIDEALKRTHGKSTIAMRIIPGTGNRITSPPAAIIISIENDGIIIPWDRCNDEQHAAIHNLLQTKTIVGHDLKQLFLRVLPLYKGEQEGVPCANLFDIMVASYLLDPGTRAHDIATILLKSIGMQVDIGKREGLFGVDYEQAARELTLLASLHEEFKSKLEEAHLTALFNDIEMPLIPVLARMERHGVKIDTKTLAQLSERITDRVEKLTTRIHTLAGKEFNIASPQQVGEVLYEKLRLPTFGVKKGKTGLSTAAAELEKLRHLHPIIPLVEEYREIVKLQNTYVDALPALINPNTGRVHTSFNQTVAATGRLSSSDPNLQNIPIRTELGREIREAFIAEPGNTLISADYSQIELRVVAALSKDKKMMAIFERGEDIHTATAAAINGVPLRDVTKDMRRAAKEVNFGIIYGMGAFGLAARTGISQAEAKDFIDRYFATFSGMKKYLEETVAFGKKHGYVETLFGRRRYVPELKAENVQLRNAGERMAVNHPVQGTAADIIKKAMIAVDEKIRQSWGDDIKMILQVHDELVFEVPESRAKELAPQIQEIMKTIVHLDVPLEVTVGTGNRWGSLLSS